MKSHRMGELQPWPAALNKDGGGAEDFINLLYLFSSLCQGWYFWSKWFLQQL